MNFVLAAKCLVLGAAALLAVFRPSTGEQFWHRLELLVGRAARRPTATWLTVGLLVLLVRGALLPFWPIPKPVIYDEFAYILQADTFARGRLTNPTHQLWPFFESPYVLQHPTYASKYPPGQALAMAAGQVLFGDPWFGVWLSCGVMAGALVWAMQGWLPPGWALWGGVLTLPLAINSYWMNSYWGGAVAAIGGALLLGGYERAVKRKQLWYALVMGLGIAILANTRPFEGLIFTIPVALSLLFSRPGLRSIPVIALVLIPAFAATGYYNGKVTGSALHLPFTEYARQYNSIPLFNFQPLGPAKVYRTIVMSDLHRTWEPEQWKIARSWQLIAIRLTDWRDLASILLGSMAMGLPIVAFSYNLWRDRRIRLPLLCSGVALVGSFIEVRFYPHYAAPAAAALFISTLQALRHLRQWKLHGSPTGRFLSRVLPVLVLGAVAASQGLVILQQEPPVNLQPPNARRDQVAASLLDAQPGRQHVILVHYTGAQSPHEEWVYNSADIDSQDVIWAHDLGRAENAPLLEYFKNRKIWLFEPDIRLGTLATYP